MPPQFAADARSHLDRIFGPQRYGASFGDPIDAESGAYHFTSTELGLHARGLNFALTRSYNSADDWYEPDGSSYMGPGWRHSYWWEISGAPVGGTGCASQLIRGDGQREMIVADGTNGDFSSCTFASGTTTVTMRDQTRFVFGNRFDYTPIGSTIVSSLYQLVQIQLPTGDHVVLAYAGSPVSTTNEPVLSTVTDTVGRVYQFTYDSAAHLIRVADPSGRAATYGYDSSGRLVTATDPSGATTHYAYDGSTRHITTNTDPDGRIRATNTYDATGAVTQQVDGNGYVTTRSNPALNTYTITDPRGTTNTYTYCACGFGLAQRSISVGGTPYNTTYAYDTYGNQTQITDRLGHVTNIAYETRANANLLSRTDPIGGVTSYQYDSKNNVTHITDARGFSTDRTYDSVTNALLTERTQIDATTYATTTLAYGDPTNPGLPTTITSPRGSVTTLAYDVSGDVVRATDPDGNSTTYEYDVLGRQTSATDDEGHTSTTTYDNADRIIGVSDPLGHVTRYTYDGSGNKTSVTDRDGNITAYAYDRNGQLTSVQQHPVAGTTYTTTLTRDGNGNVTRVTEANGAVRDTTYSGFDQVATVTEQTSQGTLTTVTNRDAVANVISRTTPDGVTTTYSYDAVYRVTAVSAPSVSVAYAYDAAGNRTSMTDATGTTTYAYDGAGRMTSAAAPNGTITYSFDLDGNRTAIGYPGAATASYAYTAAGRLSTVTDWSGRQTIYQYRPTGLVSSVAYPNGMVATYAYDAVGRLTQLTNAVGATTTTSHAYTLDPEGNRIAVAEFVSGITAAGSTDTITYGYDGLNRLTSSVGAAIEGFILDGASNITSRTGPGATYTYDGADRLQSDGTLAYGWSAADRLTSRGVPPPPPPSVTFRSQSTANNGAGAATLTINAPAGTQPGDLLLAFIYIGPGDATIDTLSGWTSIGGPAMSGTNHNGRAFYHVAAAGDPASWSWTFGTWTYYECDIHCIPYSGPNTPPAIGSIVGYSGVDPNTPLSPSTASTSAIDNQNPSAAAIVTGYPNEMVVASYGQYCATPLPTPSGWTGRASAATTYNTGGALKVEERRYPQAGQAGQVDWNGCLGRYVAFLVGLKPAPPPPPPPSDTFTYDALGRLTGSSVAGVTRAYAYNGDGLLQSRTQSGTTASLLWDPNSSPSRLVQIGLDRIVYGLGPLYVVKADGSTLSFAKDGGQSVRAEVNGAGAVIGAFRYRAYGSISQTAGSSSPTYLGYAGQLVDLSGLLYMRARWYDPASGRFVAGDPLDDPFSNLYGYGAANPMSFNDPTGLLADAGDDGGACVDDGCADNSLVSMGLAPSGYVPYSDATVDAANRAKWHPEIMGPDLATRGVIVVVVNSIVNRPASVPLDDNGTITPDVQARVNAIGREDGCHECGTTDPGTRSGNFVADHQPPRSLRAEGAPFEAMAHCKPCSDAQGPRVLAAKNRGLRFGSYEEFSAWLGKFIKSQMKKGLDD